MANLDFWRGAGPFHELRNLQRAMDRWLGEGYKPMANELDMMAPTCEVSEDQGNYIVKFDIPGMAKDQLKIELQDNVLTVAGERREEKKTEEKRRHIAEITYGSFMRTIQLPTMVDEKKVEAHYEHGVLTVTVPKAEAARSRQITIN